MTPQEREFLHQTSLKLPTVNRALALYVAMLAGFWGGHKFLMGARREGIIYLAFSWTAVPLLASLADLITLARQPAIGHGFLKRRLLARHPADRSVVERAVLGRLGKAALCMATVVGLLAWSDHSTKNGTAEQRVTRLCDQIKIGMPIGALTTFIQTNEFRAGTLAEGSNSLVHWPSSGLAGRHGCVVSVEASVVSSSTYFFLD